jgi:hypothetical protein
VYPRLNAGHWSTRSIVADRLWWEAVHMHRNEKMEGKEVRRRELKERKRRE